MSQNEDALFERDLDLELLDRARNDLLAFTLYTNENYEINWHHRELAKKLNAFIRGDIKFLMVFMPPRHGKSELVSRRLPAFLHGKYPDCEIMAASYLDSLASDMCVDVQKIIDSPEYKKIFPNTKIWPQGTSYSKGTRNSSEHHIVGHRGKYRGQGVGGSFTGKGANFCFIAGTKVLTLNGECVIESLKPNDLVWSFNHESQKTELKRIEKISSRDVSSLVQVKTTLGSKIICTPDHPFFVEGKNYCEAQTLLKGDGVRRAMHNENVYLYPVMQTMRLKVRETKIRVSKAITPWAHRLLLFFGMFKKTSCDKEQTKMRDMLKTMSKKDSSVLLQRMQAKTVQTQKSNLRTMRDIVSTIESTNCILLNGMQKLPPLKQNDRFWESKIQGWHRESISFGFLQNASINIGERFKCMYYMFFGLSSTCPPHRRTKREQSDYQFDNSLQRVPYNTPQIEGDTISSVERISGQTVRVYDIQVEGNNNFFANKTLVHNCIIDDPIKGREIADSQAFRERLWNFYNNDLFSRLETNLETGRQGQVLVTQTRWHEDDLSGRLIELMHKEPNAVQWEIVNYPAIRVDLDTESDPRKIGEPLWPEKYNLEQLNQIRASSGPRAWSSLYQQAPVPATGGLFKDEMFEVDEIPEQFDYSFITADTSYKEKQENDFTVFTCFGFVHEKLYIRDVWRAQIKSSEVEIYAEKFIRKFLGYGFRGTYIEPKGHGIYLNQKFALKGLMIPSEGTLKEFYSDRKFDKVERANNIVPHMAFTKIVINKNIPDTESLLSECLSFPRGKHDDFVDTLIDGVKFAYARQLSTFDIL